MESQQKCEYELVSKRLDDGFHRNTIVANESHTKKEEVDSFEEIRS